MQRLKQLQATSNATSNLQKGIINPPESSLTRTIQQIQQGHGFYELKQGAVFNVYSPKNVYNSSFYRCQTIYVARTLRVTKITLQQNTITKARYQFENLQVTDKRQKQIDKQDKEKRIQIRCLRNMRSYVNWGQVRDNNAHNLSNRSNWSNRQLESQDKQSDANTHRRQFRYQNIVGNSTNCHIMPYNSLRHKHDRFNLYRLCLLVVKAGRK